MIRKAFKYRLYPNKEQEQKLFWTLDRCRELYNAALDERKSAAPRFYAYHVHGTAIAVEAEEIDKYPKSAPPEKQRGLVKARSKNRPMRSVTKFGQSRELTEIKHDIRPEYQEINDHILRNVLDRVDKAFDGFFRRCKNGETPGFPRFMGKSRYDSLTTDNGFKLKIEQGNKKLRGTLQLLKIGNIKVKLHRKLEGKIKTCTVKHEGKQWYVCFSCEVSEPEKMPVSSEDVGIDLGVTHFAALSDGTFIDNPRYYRKAEKTLERRSQALSRKKKGSHRREKAKKLVARAHRKIRNQRKDFLHKGSRDLVNQYQLIVFEDLQTANLVKRPKPKQDEDGKYLPNGAAAKGGLNKSISDAGWGQFVDYCTYKAAWAGRTVLQVKPNYTSQICPGCGTVKKKTLEERWHSCECGCSLDRDHAAAINILRLGQNTLREGQVLCTSHALPLAPPEKPKGKVRVEPAGPKNPAKRSPLLHPSQGSLWDGP